MSLIMPVRIFKIQVNKRMETMKDALEMDL